jgi:hypothetical protein
MYGKLMCLVSCVLVLGVAGNALADLVDHWKFDDGSGTTAFNSVAGGTDGTIDGATWVNDPTRGVALNFDGIDDVVTMIGYKGITGSASRSMCLWFKTDGLGGTGPNGRGLIGWGTPTGSGVRWELVINKQGDPRVVDALRINASSGTRTCETVVTDSMWHHVAVTLNDDGSPTSEEMHVYLDGVEESYSQTNSGVAINTGSDTDVRVGNGSREDQNGFFSGLIDDVRIFDHALTEDEILFVMEGGGSGYPYALGPNPADGALHKDTWVSLSWQPGDSAVSHDVYIGDNFDDVNAGAESTFQGNQTSTSLIAGFPGYAFPDGLVPGTTYYWRIDEVNEAEPNSPWKGDTWSFSIPPKTAYFPDPAVGAESVAVDVELSWTAGYGAKLHTVYFGDNFDDVNNAAGGLPQGATTYTPGPLEMAKTYYWRVDEFDAVDTYKGEVWSFTTEGAVGNPEPANGAVDVKQTAILSWMPGVFAASHQVYFGADKEAVSNADTSSPEYKGVRALGAESYDPGKLEWNTTYNWRIDEVNDVNPDSPWKGSLWSFTTANFLVVDDFENYDVNDNQIWYAWHDGLGYGVPGTDPYYAGNGTGSAVGDESTPSYTEETIVHGGNQSMPVFYDNSVLRYSEVDKALTYPRDWTENGITTLSIWFRGNSDNAAETLYVALNGSAVVNHDNPDAAQITSWTEWTVDLQAFVDQGVNLANVNTIALGLGNKNNPVAGGSGTMYFDDIRLYPPAQ